MFGIKRPHNGSAITGEYACTYGKNRFYSLSFCRSSEMYSVKKTIQMQLSCTDLDVSVLHFSSLRLLQILLRVYCELVSTNFVVSTRKTSGNKKKQFTFSVMYMYRRKMKL